MPATVPMRLGKGRVSETKEGMRCSSLNSISSLGVHLAQHKKSDPDLWKAPAFEYAGAIGKRNQASECWLPPVSQQG